MNDYCLGYIDETRNVWECEDSFEYRLTDDGSYIVSGQVNHFTTFAILLGDFPDQQAEESEQTSTSSELDEAPPVIIIIAIVAVAIVIIIVAIVGIEIWRRKELKKEDEDLNIESGFYGVSLSEMIRNEKGTNKQASEGTISTISISTSSGSNSQSSSESSESSSTTTSSSD